MDMMAGGDLEYYLIRKGRFAEELVRFYMAECIIGLKYLHDRGIMHRDLKVRGAMLRASNVCLNCVAHKCCCLQPANILLGTDGHIRLSDLGLAVFVGSPSGDVDDLRFADDRGTATPAPRKHVRGKAGTPGFWAPEMLRRDHDGRAGKYDHRADFWSFGCMLYALLAGRGPFTVLGGDTNDDNDATLHAAPRMPSDIFSAKAKSLIRGLLTRDLKDRLGCGPRGWLDVMVGRHKLNRSLPKPVMLTLPVVAHRTILSLNQSNGLRWPRGGVRHHGSPLST